MQSHRSARGLAITVEARWPVTLASQAWRSCNQDQAVSARGNGKLPGPAYRAGGPDLQLDPTQVGFRLALSKQQQLEKQQPTPTSTIALA